MASQPLSSRICRRRRAGLFQEQTMVVRLHGLVDEPSAVSALAAFGGKEVQGAERGNAGCAEALERATEG